jgi:hypothetical protein
LSGKSGFEVYDEHNEKTNRLIDIVKIADVLRTVAKVLFKSGGQYVRIASKTCERVRERLNLDSE